jgi:hypothetical protein
VTRKMHHMGTELRDSVEQVRRGRSRAHVQIDLVTMQRGLDGGADALLLASDTQIALSRRANDEHAEILRLGRSQLTDDVVHTRLRIADPRLQGCAFRGSPSFCLLLFSLTPTLSSVRFGLFSSSQLRRQRRLFFRVS